MTTTPQFIPRVEVRSLADGADPDDARFLLTQQRDWLASLGIDPEQVQPGAVGDYADPLRYYAPPDGTLLIARAGGRPCGIVGMCRLAERPAGPRSSCRGHRDPAVELKRMYVLPEARGTGAGRRLLDEAIAWARRVGAAEVCLETVPGQMAAAAAMYRSAGFRPAPALGHTDTPGLVTMVLDLRPGRTRPFVVADVAHECREQRLAG
jgi:GNAT superfamily N-acetyltransferase